MYEGGPETDRAVGCSAQDALRRLPTIIRSALLIDCLDDPADKSLMLFFLLSPSLTFVHEPLSDPEAHIEMVGHFDDRRVF